MKRDGVPIPDDLAVVPTLPLGLVGYLDAFYELDTERHHGQGLMRIPWGSIVRYGQHYGYNVDELLFFIRRMDDAHLENMRKRTSNGGSEGLSQVVRRPARPD
jgi:hypothetical protein